MQLGSKLMYGLDEFPPFLRCLIYGFQWAVIFLPIITIVSTILIPHLGLQGNEKVLFFQRLLIATGALMVLQTLWRHRYPVLDGPASALLLTSIVLAPQGLSVIQGGMIAGGVFLLVLSVFGWMQYLQTLFTDNVIGVILILISLTLIPFLAPMVIGSESARPQGDPFIFLISCLVICMIALLSHWLKGFPKTISMFLGIVVGTVLMAAYGKVDVSGVSNAAWFSMPSPLFYGTPQFSLPAIIAFIVAYLAVLVNVVGSIYGIGEVVGKEEIDLRVKRGVAVTGVGGLATGFLGVIGTVSYSISPGVVLITRVGSRYAVTVCGIFLFALAFFQKLLALLTSIPASIIGAVMVVAMAAQIGAGISVLTRSTDSLTPRDYMVIGMPLLMGSIASILPEAFFLSIPTALRALLKNGLVVGVILVLLLEHVLLPTKRSDG